MKKTMIGLALLALGVSAGLLYVSQKRASPEKTGGTPVQGTETPTPGLCSAHGVPDAGCPWCDESLIEKGGQCGGHGVPEALCSRCNASLIPGFKAVSDWCAGHEVPESQCAKCKGGDLPPGEQAKPKGSK
jgi:hypothetical protein